MTAATQTRKLTAAQAKRLAKLTAAAARAKAIADAAKRALQEAQDQYRDLIPPSTDPKDAGKDVRQIEVGGFRVRVSTYAGGDYFSLKDYREAGGRITVAMAPHVHAGEDREKWTVKDLRGPKDPEAVNPAT